jgi:hypothetical protein
MHPVEGDPKEIVRSGYDLCGLRYNSSRPLEAGPELRPLIETLPANAEVLDIG